jgi:hypothetical protein
MLLILIAVINMLVIQIVPYVLTTKKIGVAYDDLETYMIRGLDDTL